MSVIDPLESRVAPHSIEAEQCLLGSMMLDKDACRKCVSLVRPEDFYSEDHREIFNAICRVFDTGGNVDGPIVREALRERGVFDEVGGTAYLAKILSSVPSAMHAESYAATVTERRSQRQMLKVLQEATHHLIDLKPSREVQDRVIAGLAEMGTRHSEAKIYTLEEVSHESFDNLSQDEKPGLRIMGLSALADIVRHLYQGGYYTVAARPSMGKSVMVKQLGLGWALAGEGVGLISVEEPRHMIADKYFASLAEIDNWRISDGRRQIKEHEWKGLTGALVKMSNAKMWIADAAQDVSEIVSVANRMKAEHGIKALIIDHIHLVSPGRGHGGRGENLNQQVTEISRALKGLYKRLEVVGITVAQLSRDSAKREKKLPQLTDLRESGSIEQDSDGVVFIHREDYYHQGDETYTPDHVAEVFVAKQRGGRTGVARLGWDGPHQRFTEYAARPMTGGVSF